MQSDNKYPLIVYKYRNWLEENHKNVLLKNQLFFTSPKDFNDPFDCRIPYDYSLLNTDDKIKEYLDRKRNEDTSMLGRNIDKEIKDFEYRIRNELNKVQELFNSLYFEGVDKHYGVFSLSEKWDSILMWSHYGDHHKGFCVGFWEEKLRNSLIVTGGRVIYPSQNDFPKLDPLGDFLKNMLQQSHAKSKEWSYEKEYRLAKLFYPTIPAIKDRIEEVSDDFFAEITIGLNASSITREEITEVGRMKKIKVFQAIQVPFKFEITREEIL